MMVDQLPTTRRARDHTRDHIVSVAADLLAEGGREAVSTRAVCAAAGVQPPTIYRIFGDKRGLLEAVAADGFATYLAGEPTMDPDADPVANLRTGWDQHVRFGLANPGLYALMYGDPSPGSPSPGAAAAMTLLGTYIRRVAESGRLRVDEEQAAQLMHSAGCGVVLTLLILPAERRDPALVTTAWEAMLRTITTDAPAVQEPGPVGAAVALRAALPGTTALSERESGLLGEWLDRIVDSS